jgi:hypothetical protein
MNDQKNWWEVVPGGKKSLISAGVIVFVLVAFLIGKAFWGSNERSSFALQEQEDKIREMEDRVARLQQELEESSKQIARLQDRPDEAPRARQSARRVENFSRREAPRVADQVSSSEMRFYQTVRSTSVFEEPSGNSRKVATIPGGSKVRVVGSSGDWLEVRSKQGRPPGFIRSDDAVVMR